MSEYLIQKETLDGIADAIIEKTGGTEQVAVPDMRPQILGLYGKNDVEAVTVEPDFSAGDYVVAPSAEGKVLGQVIVAKPGNLLPGNIAEGVDIAGIVGKLATDGNNAKVAFGTFKGTNAVLTINHNLGVVPDFVYITESGNASGAAGKNRAGWSMSSAFKELVGATIGSIVYSKYYYNYTNYLKPTQTTSAQLESPTADVYIHGATETTFNTPAMDSVLTFMWIAIGGLT